MGFQHLENLGGCQSRGILRGGQLKKNCVICLHYSSSALLFNSHITLSISHLLLITPHINLYHLLLLRLLLRSRERLRLLPRPPLFENIFKELVV